MSRRSPFEVRFSPEDRAGLDERASSRTAAHARIVLAAADGAQDVDTVQRVGVCVIWRRNGASALRGRTFGLAGAPSLWTPRHFGAAVVAGSRPWPACPSSDVTFRCRDGARLSWPPRREAKGSSSRFRPRPLRPRPQRRRAHPRRLPDLGRGKSHLQPLECPIGANLPRMRGFSVVQRGSTKTQLVPCGYPLVSRSLHQLFFPSVSTTSRLRTNGMT
jgi:hypothetical protein